MIYRRILIILFPLLFLAGIFSFTADDIINVLTKRLSDWTDKHPVEKAYLHFDKPYYTAGEDIWFKAYVFTDGDLQPDSSILNVELINEIDTIKQSLKVQLHNGLGFGDIALPDTMHEGNYRIRAYTQYMRNAGAEYFFDKTIVIGNVITNKIFTKADFTYARQALDATIRYTDANGAAYANKPVTYSVLVPGSTTQKGKAVTDADGVIRLSIPAANPASLHNARLLTTIAGTREKNNVKSIPISIMAGTADVQFFPEGGNMLSGVPAKIAFKAIGTDGLSVDVKGEVVDNNGRRVAELSTSHLGMGVFEFTPAAGLSYKASLTYADGSKGTLPLPAAGNEGYVLNVIGTDPNRVIVSVASNKPISEKLNLIAQSNGRVCYAAKTTVGETTFSSVIPVSKFPSGIIQFTLFSATGEPLNQRLVFVHGHDMLNIGLNAGNQSQAPRSPVTLNFEAKSADGKPDMSSLSVAVINESIVPVDEDAENNIFASLLLSSDIKGYIEKPAYYFNGITPQKRADLDVLMLTQGYHRFEWKNLAEGTPQADRFAAEKTFTISGRVTNLSGKPVSGGKISLLNFNDGLFKLDTVTDANGRFAFTDIIYPDSIKFLLQARTAKNKKDVMIKLDTIPPVAASNYASYPDFKVNPGQSVSGYAQNSRQFYFEQMKRGLGNHVISLAEVKIIEKRNALKHSSNLNGPGNADQVVMGKDLTLGCIQLADCLQGRLLGVVFYNGAPYSTRRGVPRPMLIVVDGAYGDASLMNSLNVQDIQSIEVLRSGSNLAVYGSQAAGGALIITTKRGDEPSDYPKVLSSGVVSYAPRGIYKSRLFYSPKYNAKGDNKLADLRSTIYWNPNVVTSDGKASVTYYNASPGNYRVVAEGVDADGRIGRQVLRYRVE